MVEIDPFESQEIAVDVPQPSVNVSVFGEGSIGDAFGGFLTSIVGGFNSLFRKIASSETTLKALVHLMAVLMVVGALLIAYRTIGRSNGG